MIEISLFAELIKSENSLFHSLKFHSYMEENKWVSLLVD